MNGLNIIVCIVVIQMLFMIFGYIYYYDFGSWVCKYCGVKKKFYNSKYNNSRSYNHHKDFVYPICEKCRKEVR